MELPLYLSPFLRRFPDHVESLLSGAVVGATDGIWSVLQVARGGEIFAPAADLAPADRLRLVEGGFLVADPLAASHSSRLLYANIETCSVCNHRCGFCPVSWAPRPKEEMPQDLFERIVDQVVEAGERGVSVFLNNYNEPTIDPLFLDRLRYLYSKGVPAALLTNAAHLSAKLVDAMRELGQLRYLGVNLPAVDPARYRELHGTTDLARVLKNLDYIFAHEVAQESAFVVLGYGDADHDRDLEGLRERYGDRGWELKKFVVQSRSGLVTTSHPQTSRRRLHGCEQIGSRPLHHLHVVTSGKAIFCCQDYHERYPVGDLRTQSVREVLAGEELAQLRRYVYGMDEAPDDFICRKCEFALDDDG
ncbi:MAG: radical SAM/SPASM domain-containing protein [Acidobacteriota bacterium]